MLPTKISARISSGRRCASSLIQKLADFTVELIGSNFPPLRIVEIWRSNFRASIISDPRFLFSEPRKVTSTK